MSVHQTFTVDPREDDLQFLCSGRDAERVGPLAYCPSCGEVTESYIYEAPKGAVSGSDLARLEREALAWCDRTYHYRHGAAA